MCILVSGVNPHYFLYMIKSFICCNYVMLSYGYNGARRCAMPNICLEINNILIYFVMLLFIFDNNSSQVKQCYEK